MSTHVNPGHSASPGGSRNGSLYIFILAVVLASGAGGGAAYAQYDTPANIDSEAAAALQSMSNYLGSRSDYSFKADIMYDEVLGSGLKVQYGAEAVAYLTKPNKFAVSYTTERGGYRLWYTAGQATILQIPENDYAAATLPGTVDQALTKLSDEYAFDPVLSEFLFINTFKTLTKNVTGGRSLGPSRVSGAMCRHLIFQGNDIDWQIWIEDGNRPVPRKLVITYKSRPESPQFIALIKDWVADKTIRDAAYKPDIPKMSSQGEFLQITGRPEFAGISIRAFQ
ncbi:MAG: DUF2092 domain-containing protein [Candidatus Dadabacteria bacterium]|nr:DUF2092 domain-containing protein [Candidatus Dadabacteria bacterium]